VGAEFAVPGVALGAGVRGVWLAPPFVVVWVWVGCWRLSFVHAVSRVLYLECLPMLLSAPALCHCDRGFCDSPYAVPLLSHAVRAPCPHLMRFASECSSGTFRRKLDKRGTLTTLVTQPLFFPDVWCIRYRVGTI
jgi:hypothetical protein